MYSFSRNGLKLIGSLLLVLGVVLVFGQTLGHDFVDYDDDVYVTANPFVKSGLSWRAAWWALTATYASNWHPLTWVSHMLDCSVYGLSPWGHHLTNVSLHAVNAVILFLVVGRLTGCFGLSFAVACLFALHPLRVESVAWVAERKDVLSGFFWLLTLAAYGHYTARPGVRNYLLVCLAFVMGLLAKPMLVSIPVLLLVMDFWPLRRMRSVGGPSRSAGGRLLLEKVPLLMLAGLFSWITFTVQSRSGAAYSLPVGSRIGNAAVSYLTYLKQLFWPVGLCPFYPKPGGGWSTWQVATAFAVLGCISVGVFLARRHRPYFLAGWLWFLVTLAPVAGFIPIGLHAYADRYTYMTQVGLCMAIVWGIADLTGGRDRLRLCGGLLGVAAVAALVVAARRQCAYWRDSVALWSRALAVTDGNYVAHDNLGAEWLQAGRYDDAIAQFRLSLRLNSARAIPHTDLAVALWHKNELEKALAHLRMALRIWPPDAVANFVLGGILVNLDMPRDAVLRYRRAVETKPYWCQARRGLGRALIEVGMWEEAIQQFEAAVELDPHDGLAERYLDYAQARRKKLAQDVVRLREEVNRSPDKSSRLNQLGQVLRELGKLQEATNCYRQAVEVDPGSFRAHKNWAIALQDLGRTDLAAEHCRQALAISPEYDAARNNLAWILATDPDPRRRNAAESLQLAEAVCRNTTSNQPVYLDTLAAAYAAGGRFEDAVRTAEAAMGMAVSNRNDRLALTIRRHLTLLKRDKPVRSAFVADDFR